MTLSASGVRVSVMAFPREDEAMTVLATSHGELSRFDTLMRVERGKLHAADAADRLD
jgi:hypothetical protein